MKDPVRVSLASGHTTVEREYAEAHNLTVLKQDAVDKSGRALPFKPKDSAKSAGSTTPSSSDPAATTPKEKS